jgi:uncharacterized protein (DUF849 family)
MQAQGSEGQQRQVDKSQGALPRALTAEALYAEPKKFAAGRLYAASRYSRSHAAEPHILHQFTGI